MKKWGLALALVLAAPSAWSQEQPGGLYIGLSGSAVYTDAAGSVETITGGFHDKSTPNGGKVFGGYMWDRWGMEFAYYYLGKYEFLNAPGTGQVQDTLETQAFVVAAVYEAPLSSALSLFARGGIAFTHAQYDCKLGCGTAPYIDTKKTGLSGMWGAGLGVRLTQHTSVRLEYEHIGNVHHAIVDQEFTDGYDMYMVGLRLMF